MVYRVIPRTAVHEQTLEIIQRHPDQAVIVYCISRRDTEAMAEFLRSRRIRAGHYHAGMNPDERRKTQENFAQERLDVIVATVAFGMGIDRSDVRCVIHAGLPKSVEHYQQESGRAGRDSLPAECVLLYSHADFEKWRSIMTRSAAELDPEVAAAFLNAQVALLDHARRLAAAATCRHRTLSEYFGQPYPVPSCNACDVCLGEVEAMADSTVAAQKILSCVARVEQRFGVGHVVDVLLGANNERIRSLGHDKLSTYGLMKHEDKKVLANLTRQLIDLDLLDRSKDEYPVLSLNEASWQVLRGEKEVLLQQPKRTQVKSSRGDTESWKGVDRGLFESLRMLRREIAEERSVPPFLIFGDATLRELARRRPGSLDGMRSCYGVGQRKLVDLGERFLNRIGDYCRQHALTTDIKEAGKPLAEPASKPISQSLREAFELFSKGRSIDDVASALGRARSTTVQYLVEYIGANRPSDINAWVAPDAYEEVVKAIHIVGVGPMKPIFEYFQGQVPYDTIRITMAHFTTPARADS